MGSGPHLPIVACVLLLGCTRPDPGPTRIIGHAGMGAHDALMPNGRESVLAALDLGIDGVELDVQLTADNVLVAFHDEQLAENTTCTGLVHGLSWRELQTCTTTRQGHGNAKIARLDSLLTEAAERHPTAVLTLDCKLFAHGDWWTYLEDFTDALVALEAHPRLSGKLQVECQVDPFLELLKRKAPHMALYRYDGNADTAIHHALRSQLTGITVHHGRISKAQVEGAKAEGLRVTLFGTDGCWSHWRALRKEPDQLQTDAPMVFAPR